MTSFNMHNAFSSLFRKTDDLRISTIVKIIDLAFTMPYETRVLSVLDPCAGKLASKVLRGGSHRKVTALLDL